jgi:hypothetical protein
VWCVPPTWLSISQVRFRRLDNSTRTYGLCTEPWKPVVLQHMFPGCNILLSILLLVANTECVYVHLSAIVTLKENRTDFSFSLVGAIGSAATAAAFWLIIRQTNLTKKQIAQTQDDLDNPSRPWIGHLQIEDKDIRFYFIPDIDPTDITAKYFLKNYGRIPARITRKRYMWSFF